MGSRKGPTAARHRIAVALALCLGAAGCGGGSYVQFASSGSPSTGVSTGGSVQVQGRSTFGVLLAIGILAGASHAGDRRPEDHGAAPAPPMDGARKVNEQDCTRPIEDWSANLKCR